MPVHDWTRVRANRFHHFHQTWTTNLAAILNAGGLPPGYFALAEQITGGPEPDIVALAGTSPTDEPGSGGPIVQTGPPRARLVARTEAARYARRGNRLAIRHPDGDLVAIVEIVSPGNKSSRYAIGAFARKAVQMLLAGVHLLIVDLFPPSRRDPQGIHKVIWDRLQDEPYTQPAEQPLAAVAYCSGAEIVAYVEPFAVGDPLPEMPLFLSTGEHVPCPLEASYLVTWDQFPAALKGDLERG